MERTSQQNLVRHKPARYYAQTFGNNKEIWKSPHTSHFLVAKAKFAEFLPEHREKQVMAVSETSAKMEFDEALEFHLQSQAERCDDQAEYRNSWKQVFAALPKRWPGLTKRESAVPTSPG